jgi:hypothetical protein
MNDRPTAAELLAAVAEFLATEVVPALDGKLRYNARVAAHVVEMVGREWLLEDAHLLGEWSRLNELDHLDDPEFEAPSAPETREQLRDAIRSRSETLVTRIRSGEADEGAWHDALVAHLKQTVADKLEVAKG